MLPSYHEPNHNPPIKPQPNTSNLDDILQGMCDTVYQHGQATNTNQPFHHGEPKAEAKQEILKHFKTLISESKPSREWHKDERCNKKLCVCGSKSSNLAVEEYYRALLKRVEEM